MKKPKPQERKYVNYREASKYIEHKLGYELRDVNGKFSRKPYDESVEYLDFWHWLYDRQELHNGCVVRLPEVDEKYDPAWCVKIVKAFEKEFGPDTEYWVEW